MKKNTGFVKPILDSTQYIMGAALSLNKDCLQADGQWGAYLPTEERQRQNKIETYNCTSFATLNCVEILINKIYGRYENKSDRFLGLKAGTRPPGNDPHTVAEAGRKHGFIPEDLLPFDSEIDTLDEYYSYQWSDMGTCIEQGQKFLQEYLFGHEWVTNGHMDKDRRIGLMKEALRYSPLGCSVSAWYEKGGVYVDMGQPNNHWTVIYGYNDTGWLCFDSYEPFRKTLSYDHEITFCKRYSLMPLEKKRDNWLIALIKYVLGKTKPQAKVPDPIVVPKEKTPRERLHEAAVACIGMDASPRDVAPDELGCAETVNEIHFKAFGEYIENPGISTTKLFAAMVDRQDKFQRINYIEPGIIIISPTGFSSDPNTPIKNGHVGIFDKDVTIMSNSSSTGKFERNYDIYTWIDRYRNKGGYPIYYFKRI